MALPRFEIKLADIWGRSRGEIVIQFIRSTWESAKENTDLMILYGYIAFTYINLYNRQTLSLAVCDAVDRCIMDRIDVVLLDLFILSLLLSFCIRVLGGCLFRLRRIE